MTAEVERILVSFSPWSPLQLPVMRADPRWLGVDGAGVTEQSQAARVSLVLSPLVPG